MKTSLKSIQSELLELLRIEEIIGSNKVTEADEKFLKRRAEEGAPRAEFDYGFYLLLNMNAPELAEPWFEKALKHCNGWGLWEASMKFAQIVDYLEDEKYIEWSIRCLRRSAWRQFPIAKSMLKEMKEHPYILNIPKA